MNYTTLDDERELPVEAVIRAPVFELLADGPADRRELEAQLDISRATCHRIVRSFEDRKLITRTDDGYVLTSLGHTVAGEAQRFTERVETATDLQPLTEALTPTNIEFDPGLFTEATITQPGPDNPHPPINRFMKLFRESMMLKSLDKTSIAPLYVDEIAQTVIDDGMTIDAIYGVDVVDHLITEYPAELKPAFEMGRCEFLMHDDIPFGLSIFDDRIGLRAYDPASGACTLFVDTAAPEAYAWGDDVFGSYRAAAQPVADAEEFPDWARTQRTVPHD